MSSSATLEVTGPAPDRRVDLSAIDLCEIGRSHDNQLCLESDSVSRRHALIRKLADGSYSITDLRSRNGTEVNGRRIDAAVEIKNGDRIRIGEFLLLFHREEEDPASRGTITDPTKLDLSIKPVTVLVMDMHNYTGLTQGMESSLMSRLLSDFWNRGAKIASAHQAWNFKTIADAVMAVWVHESVASAGHRIREPFLAALEIVGVIRRLSAEYGLEGKLQTGAGITTGTASLGQDVIGDTVNQAFRMEAATRNLGVDLLACDSTYMVAHPPQRLFRQFEVPLKGFPEPVHCFGTGFESVREWLFTSESGPESE